MASFSLPSLAAPPLRIIAIADGDTLTVLDGSNQKHKLRIAEIDAPEKKQPFGKRAKQSLADLCLQANVTVKPEKTDRYGRTIARVSCNGTDVSTHQVKNGMAWVYAKYSTDRSLIPQEQAARKAGRGLWADSAPIPPWEWRQKKNR